MGESHDATQSFASTRKAVPTSRTYSTCGIPSVPTVTAPPSGPWGMRGEDLLSPRAPGCGCSATKIRRRLAPGGAPLQPVLGCPGRVRRSRRGRARHCTVPQPPGDYGPLLYPTNTEGTAGLTLDFTVVHPVGRRGTEYAYDEHALNRA